MEWLFNHPEEVPAAAAPAAAPDTELVQSFSGIINQDEASSLETVQDVSATLQSQHI